MNKLIRALVFILAVIGITIIACTENDVEIPNEVPNYASLLKKQEHKKKFEPQEFVFPNENNNNCLVCHAGVEPIRDPKSGMMQAIYVLAEKAGYKDNDCIVCHGGNPDAKDKKKAHSGSIPFLKDHNGPDEFYPEPGSSWINAKTCGQCHQEQISAQMNSLMMTEQGKIQGTLWGFGGMEGYEHTVGNHLTKNPEDPHKRLGSSKYKKYMQSLSKGMPNIYPSEMTELPEAPTAEQVQKNPNLAVYTYLRQECLRCHTGSKGRQKRGDFRGIGCSSCHIPYSNNGFYEGNDATIPKNKQGHLLVHSIQAGRDSKVKVHEKSYSGVPVETCTTCHNRGKRIGVSYQGLMETEYSPTYDPKGAGQQKLHTKRYLHLKEDVHYQKGMLCQDCHTSNDLHGDGFLSGTTLAPVEVECQDCHGTTKAFPWELPLGYGDEFDTIPAKGKARGVTRECPEYLKHGSDYDPEEGFLLTARGNPLTNVVRVGDSIKVHLASGKDLMLQPLKKLTDENKLSQAGRVAMHQVPRHMERMECYTCHATWAPQCYGCHIKVDYSGGRQHIDWLAAAKDIDKHGQTGCARGSFEDYLVDGEVSETRTYLRWENPPLSQNGEGRISPTIPGCQTTITVIGKDGKALLQNHIFKVPNAEGADSTGQLAIDMSPVQPHTVQKEARECESCHSDPAAMGYGIGGGKFFADPSDDLVIDLMDADKQVLPKKITVQKPGIPNLHHDWSRYVTEEGKQLQTVGHHFDLSGPLNNSTRNKMDRRGVCLSCHQKIPDQDLAVSLLSHVAKTAKVNIDNETHSDILKKSTLITAWVQVMIPVLVAIAGFMFFYRRRRRKLRR